MSTKVFLCWSGTRSRHFAEIVRDWLPKVLGPSLAYNLPFPPRSKKVVRGLTNCGMRWITPIAGFYASPRKRLGSPWVHFEAGLLVRALSKSSKPGMAETKERRVFPLLCDITGEVLKGPLSAYQSTSSRDLDDVLRLIEAIYQIMLEKSGWSSLK